MSNQRDLTVTRRIRTTTTAECLRCEFEVTDDVGDVSAAARKHVWDTGHRVQVRKFSVRNIEPGIDRLNKRGHG